MILFYLNINLYYTHKKLPVDKIKQSTIKFASNEKIYIRIFARAWQILKNYLNKNDFLLKPVQKCFY